MIFKGRTAAELAHFFKRNFHGIETTRGSTKKGRGVGTRNIGIVASRRAICYSHNFLQQIL
jgi:hypothetical protein